MIIKRKQKIFTNIYFVQVHTYQTKQITEPKRALKQERALKQ